MQHVKLRLVIVDSQFSTESSDGERPPCLGQEKQLNIRFKVDRVEII